MNKWDDEQEDKKINAIALESNGKRILCSRRMARFISCNHCSGGSILVTRSATPPRGEAGSLLPSVPFFPATVGKETKRVWFHCGGSKRHYGCDVCASIEQGDDASTPAAQNKRQEGLENSKGRAGLVFWDTVSNETSWNRPAEINNEMFEKMKSEYQAPADGKAMPSSPPSLHSQQRTTTF